MPPAMGTAPAPWDAALPSFSRSRRAAERLRSTGMWSWQQGRGPTNTDPRAQRRGCFTQPCSGCIPAVQPFHEASAGTEQGWGCGHPVQFAGSALPTHGMVAGRCPGAAKGHRAASVPVSVAAAFLMSLIISSLCFSCPDVSGERERKTQTNPSGAPSLGAERREWKLAAVSVSFSYLSAPLFSLEEQR